MSEDALSGAKFNSGLFLSDFPVKIRVLTLDPLVHLDDYGNTRYAFVVFNLDQNKVQVLDKGPGFAQAFQEKHLDEDLGGDIRNITIKIKTNGESGKKTRYTFDAIGEPSPLTPEQTKLIKDARVDLDAIIKKNSPNALRLSEINNGAQLSADLDTNRQDDTRTVADPVEGEDEPINVDDIPF